MKAFAPVLPSPPSGATLLASPALLSGATPLSARVLVSVPVAVPEPVSVVPVAVSVVAAVPVDVLASAALTRGERPHADGATGARIARPYSQKAGMLLPPGTQGHTGTIDRSSPLAFVNPQASLWTIAESYTRLATLEPCACALALAQRVSGLASPLVRVRWWDVWPDRHDRTVRDLGKTHRKYKTEGGCG